MKYYAADEVFGMNRELPLNYVIRDNIDNELVDSLARGKHIVIHGSSKQGKTSLRKKCLQEDDYIVVTCQSKWGLRELNTSILKEAGYEVTRSTERTQSGEYKIHAKAKGGLGVFGFGKAEAEGGFEGGKHTGKKQLLEPLELDPDDVNDIIRALRQIDFKKFIICEDFHYLPLQTQKEFSYSLKAYHENSRLCFIIIGVWKESNRLTRYNGDLTNRVISIDADLWKDQELSEVIAEGERLLNIVFSDQFKSSLVKGCFESVYIVQEACFRACKAANITSTVKNKTEVSSRITAEEVVRRVVDEHNGRYEQALITFSRGFQETKLDMYKWLLYVVVCEKLKSLETGIKLASINRKIVSAHPEGKKVQAASVTNALSNIGSLQALREIRPIILDYDEQVLNVVDRSFLIWLSVQDRERILRLLDFDDDVIEKVIGINGEQ